MALNKWGHSEACVEAQFIVVRECTKNSYFPCQDKDIVNMFLQLIRVKGF